MSSVKPIGRWEFVRLAILATILGMCIANAVYLKFLHPWFEEIGVCHCHNEN